MLNREELINVYGGARLLYNNTMSSYKNMCLKIYKFIKALI